MKIMRRKYPELLKMKRIAAKEKRQTFASKLRSNKTKTWI